MTVDEDVAAQKALIQEPCTCCLGAEVQWGLKTLTPQDPVFLKIHLLSSVGGAESCTARAAPGAVQDFPLRLLWAAQTPHPQHIGAPQDSPELQLTLCFLKPSFNAVGPC